MAVDDQAAAPPYPQPYYEDAAILVAKREWDDVRAEVDRLRWLERRVEDVKAALEGKSIVDAALIRKLL